MIHRSRCVIVRHLGSQSEIGEKVRFLYGKWLPESGEELRYFPCFFITSIFFQTSLNTN